MRVACLAVMLATCVVAAAQTPPTFELHGSLKLVDRPPQATPVDSVMVSLHPLQGGFDIQAHPDRYGKFVFKNVRPGRYSFSIPIAGRILSFTDGARKLAPDGFELNSASPRALRIIVSMKTSELFVKVRGLPNDHSGVDVLLVPADPYLTLRLSCFLNALTAPETTFRFVPLGKYRILVVDARYQSNVAAYAPRFPDFLKSQATPVDIVEGSETKATAAYVDDKTVLQAIRHTVHHP